MSERVLEPEEQAAPHSQGWSAAPDGTRFDVFLSHNSRDKPAVLRLADRLRQAGLRPWLDDWCLTPGREWQTEIAEAVQASAAFAFFVGPGGQGDWAHEELSLAQDRAAKDRDRFRLIPILLPGVPEPFDHSTLPPFLRMRTWVDLRGGLDGPRGVDALCRALDRTRGDPDEPAGPEPEICPYRGLEVFDEEHTDFFFGRDGEIQRLREALKGSRVLTVLGPSGSGKSSLVRAGLVPALRTGARASDEPWTIRVLRPGERPLTDLAAELTKLSSRSRITEILDDLSGDQRTLDLTTQLALSETMPAGRCLWVIDQFEEVFTLCQSERERAAFVANLLYASAVPGGRCVVVLAMRADFYPRCAAYPELAAAVAAHQFLVSPMDREALREAIVEPARRVGLLLEPGLAETILDDVAARPGTLPLLEHALLELWERRQGRQLTLNGYQQSGGVQGAIARRSEAVYDSLDEGQKAIVKRTLPRLTRPGEGTEDTRRRATLDELVTSPAEREAVEAVVRALADARLLTTSGTASGQITGGATVEVAHEALIREWPRLRGWLDEGREALVIHHRLIEAAGEWEQQGRTDDFLYRGARLVQALEWRDTHDVALNDRERAFVEASVALQTREHEANERQRRFRRLVTRVSMVAAPILLVLAIIAGWKWSEADGQRQRAVSAQAIAQSRQLAAQAERLFVSQLDLGLLLSVEAYQKADTTEAFASLLDGRYTNPALARILGSNTGSGQSVAFSPDGARFLGPNTGSGQSVAFSPDGQRLASASNDQTIRLWDVASGQPLGQPLTGHTSTVYSVAFSPDGQRLASASNDQTIRLWDVASGQPLGQPLTGHTGPVQSVAFSPDGQRLASASNDRTIRLWDVASGQPLGQPLTGHTGPVQSVAFSPDGQRLASGNFDQTIRLWDVASGQPLGQPLTGHTGPVQSVAFSPDGQRLASGSFDQTIRLWDVASGQPLGPPLTGHANTVQSVAFSPDGTRLASGGWDQTLRLWDAATGQPLGQPLTGHTDPVESVAFSPDGQRLASGSFDQTIRLWDVASGQPLRGHTGPVLSVAFSPDGQRLASGGLDRTIRLWDVASGQPLGQPLTGHTNIVSSVAFSPDGQWLASASNDRTIRLWDVASGQPLGQPLTGHTGSVESVAFSPDGQRLASGSIDGTIRLWDVAGGQPLGQPLTGHTDPVESVAFSPDGQRLASASNDRTVRLWDVASGQPLGQPLTGHTGSVESVAFSPDGQRLASASIDGTIRLWDVAGGQPLGQPLTGHTDPVESVAFSPDGQRLASGGDATIRLWDVASGQPLGQPLTGHPVQSVAFSPDGQRLASGSGDRTIRLWDVGLSSWVAEACRRANRNLTMSEWKQHLSDEPYRKTCPDLPGPSG